MSITFRPGLREAVPLMIAIAGPSKSGKTYSAHRLAAGMADPKQTFMINTEGARGHMYLDRFPCQIFDLDEPFAMSRYREAIIAAKDAGAKCLIIDSLSHAHEGIGGMLDCHEKELDRLAGDNWEKRNRMTWAAWVKPKAEEALLIGTLIQQSFPIIVCLRAKEKLKITKGKDPEDLGWQPICSDRFSYETIATLILPPGAQGRPDLKAMGTGLREPVMSMFTGSQIDEELGRKLLAWANTPAEAENRITLEEQEALRTECLAAGLTVEALVKAAKVQSLAAIGDIERARAWIARKKEGAV